MARSANLSTQTLYVAGSAGLSQLILAGTYIFAANSLSPKEFGAIVVAITIGLTTSGLLDFGMSYLCTRELANGRMSIADASARFTAKVILSVLLGGLLLSTVASDSLLWISGIVLASSSLNQAHQIPLRAAGLSHWSGVVQLAERVSLAALYLGLSCLGLDTGTGLWLATALSSVLGALAAWYVTPPLWKLRFVRPTQSPWKGCRNFGVYGLATTGAGFELPLFAWQAGSAMAGVYATVNRWISPMLLMGNAFSTAALPIMSRSASTSQMWRSLKGALWLLGGAIAASLLVALFAGPITSLVLSDAYSSSASALQLLAIGAAIGIVNQPLATYMMAIGRDKIVAALTALGTAFHLMICTLGAADLGVRAPGSGLITSQAIILVCLVIAASRGRTHDVRSAVPARPD